MSELLTTSQAASLLKVSQGRVRQLILEGRITTQRIGRDHLILLKDINQFLIDNSRLPGRPKTK